MANVFDHLHIKRSSAGSPNELSFDVLDAARSELDEKESKAKSVKAPKASQGSYHGVTGRSTLSGEAEVEKRKKARRARTIRMWFAVSLALVVVVGIAVFVGYSLQKTNNTFKSDYNAIIGKFVEADELLADVDPLMSDPFAEKNKTREREILDAIPSAVNKTESAEQDVKNLTPGPISGQDEIAINEAGEAAKARLAMLDAAAGAFELSLQSSEIESKANKAWENVIAADQHAREATSSANHASTEEETKAARDMTESALEELQSSRDALADIAKKWVKLDFSKQLAYLDKRIEALKHGIATSDALLELDRDKAVVENDAYNTADQEAVELANSLPLSISETIESSFKEQAEAFLSDYEKAREQAISADAAIRGYLEH